MHMDPAAKVPPEVSAREAGLRYVTDEKPGISRQAKGKEIAYVDAHGKPVTDSETLGRIKRLAIPPAWAEVWICPLANGHLQATGKDARGRKQYRYHPRLAHGARRLEVRARVCLWQGAAGAAQAS